MDRIRWEHVAAAALLLVLGAMAASRLRPGAPAPPAPAVPVRISGGGAGDAAGGARLVVHVAGAVRRPGVYRLRAGLRVDDAVQRAGGPTRRGDLSALNLAAELEDGRQVLVPARVRASGGTVAPGAGSTVAGDGAPINLNTATIEQLDTLEGIGPTTAQKIVDWRTENGGFGSVEELGRIPGIGEKRMATLRARLTV